MSVIAAVLGVLLSVLAPDMGLKSGAVLVEHRGVVAVRTQAVDLYMPQLEPEVRVRLDVDPGTPLLVCVVSASDGKPGGWWAAYGNSSVVRHYEGQAFHTRCAALVAGWSVNHYLEIRSTGMDGRRDFIRRVTVTLL